MSQAIDSKFGGYVAIPFEATNLNSSLTNGAMAIGAGNTEVIVPFSGSLVGIGVRGTSAAPAGTAAFVATVNGVQFGRLSATVSTATANTNQAYGTRAVGEVSFSAGDAVTIQAVTSTTFAPTTIEYDAVLYIQLDND
jgi:hypothetical protein